MTTVGGAATAEGLVAKLGETGKVLATNSTLRVTQPQLYVDPDRDLARVRELKQFLLLTRDWKISPLTPRGSFAGAMGIPQFMPTSFRPPEARGSTRRSFSTRAELRMRSA